MRRLCLLGFDLVADFVRHGDPAHGTAASAVEGAQVGEEAFAQEPHLATVERNREHERYVHFAPSPLVRSLTKVCSALRAPALRGPPSEERGVTNLTKVEELLRTFHHIETGWCQKNQRTNIIQRQAKLTKAWP